MTTDSEMFEIQLQGKDKQELSEKVADIARFVGEKLVIEYIPALRPSNLAVEVIEELLSKELAQLESEPKYRQLSADLEAAQLPILTAFAAELTKTVASFVPEVNGFSYGYPVRPEPVEGCSFLQ